MESEGCPNCGGYSPSFQPDTSVCLDDYHRMPGWAIELYYGLRRWDGGLAEGIKYIMRHVRPIDQAQP